MTANPQKISPKQINDLLPQTQCGQCNYNGCLPYAKAISEGAPHNQCPPGGARVIQKLSELLGRNFLPLNPDNGVEAPWKVAKIREPDCIGCTKCIQACPVDAIVGSGKLMHTVISDLCTGCGLCLPPCPTDCIDLSALAPKQPGMLSESDFYTQTHQARSRMQAREIRLKKLADQKKRDHALHKVQVNNQSLNQESKIEFIQAALARSLAQSLIKKKP